MIRRPIEVERQHSLEVASWAPATVLARLATRRYAVSWFRNVYVAAVDDRPQPHHPAMTVDEVTDDTLEQWLAVLHAGNELTTPDTAAISDEWARASRDVAGTTDYLAYLDGVAVGCGSIIPESGFGWIGGAATVPPTGAAACRAHSSGDA